MKMADKKVGKVTHFYDKLGVAVVKLDADLKVGDQIKVVSGDDEFTQTVESMQVDHKPIESAKKGDEAGLKLDQEAKRGAKLFLVE